MLWCALNFAASFIDGYTWPYLNTVSCIYILGYLQANLTACFEVQSGLPSPPHLFWVVPDVTWAESLSERTFHGNEVRVMVRPGGERSAWNTKRRTPWKPRPDRTEQSLALVHLYIFIKTVCVREENNMWCFILGKDTWVPSVFDLHHADICPGIQACPQGIRVIILYHRENRCWLFQSTVYYAYSSCCSQSQVCVDRIKREVKLFC